jgi:Skp family chaperone for outer membrane proteins
MWLFGRVWFVLALLAQPLAAQQVPQLGPSSVLIVDSDELFLKSQFGQRLIAELDAEAALVQAENDRIVASLLAEESELTQQRPTMSADVFRETAAAFDAKAQEFRRERDAAAEQLVGQRNVARTEFLERIYPIVGRLMLERGASVVLDRSRRSVFLAVGSVDITPDAIALIDQTLGDGSRPAPEGTSDAPDVAPLIAPIDGTSGE